MNNRLFIATAKAYEARDRLRGAHAAVTTLSEIECKPEAKGTLVGLMEALEAHATALEAYSRTLLEATWEKPDWRTDEQILKDQLRDVERGIRIHKRGNTPGIIRDFEARRGYIKADLELEYAARRVRWCAPCPLR